MEQKQQKRQEEIKRIHSAYYNLLMVLMTIGCLFALTPYSFMWFRVLILNQATYWSDYMVVAIFIFAGFVLALASWIALERLPWPSTKKQVASYALGWGVFLGIVAGAFACIATLNGEPILAIAGWFLTSILIAYNAFMVKMSM